MNEFDSVAASFDTDARIRRAETIAEKIRSALTGGERTALEFGCGTGLIGLQLADAFERLLLVDSSPGMIAQLERKLERADHPALTVRCCDLLTEEATEIRVDLIFCSLVLHHIADVRAALTKLRAMLMPGGRLLAVDLDTDDGSFHAAHPHFHGHHGFDRQALAAMAREAGFRQAESETFYHGTKESGGEGRAYSLFLLTAEN